ncbi:hypothetical protein D1953_06890 [Peribacillus asahii]|uniref:Uncharacterized protein n=1 Tax=Peribacillus asahii TaxID=228899 RepID=A0A398BHX9_9BACI|nr:hypothetical protein [Peribacillus asahii]RID87036.1 hypothetical protein D1953_06890 [Peribacillus asahii]
MAYKRHSELTEEERKEYRERVRRDKEKRKQQEKKVRRKQLILLANISIIMIIILSFIGYKTVTHFTKKEETVSADSKPSLNLGVTDADTILVQSEDDAWFYGLSVDNGNEEGIQHARENGIVLEKGTKVEYGTTEDHRIDYVKVLDGPYVGTNGYVHFLDISEIEK